MTSASERADDDVVVITEDDRMDQPPGAHAAAEPADPELGGTELGGNRDAGDDPADDSADTPRGAWGQGSPAQGSVAQRFPAQGSSYAATGREAAAGDAPADIFAWLAALGYQGLTTPDPRPVPTYEGPGDYLFVKARKA